MVKRIAGVDLPANKRVDIGLTAIYGIGRVKAAKICDATEIDRAIRCKDLTEDQVKKLRDYIEQHEVVEGDKRKEVNMNIKSLVEIRSYRGLRHAKNLPVRGQSTRSNARTAKGISLKKAKKKK